MPFDVPGRTTPLGEIVSPLAEEDEESDIELSTCADSRLIFAARGGPPAEEFGLTDEVGGAGAASALIPWARKATDSSNGSLLPLELRGGRDDP